MRAPVIALCVTCKNRTEHLERTLPRNIADNAGYHALKIVVVDYNSQDHLREYYPKAHAKDIESGRVVFYRFTEPGPFRMAHAKNIAHRLAIREGADVLVNMDADNFTGAGFAEWVAEAMAEGPDVFLWSRMIKGIGLPRGISGRIAVTKHQFLNVGGYDERFATWAPDDKDFNQRLQRMGYKAREVDQRFLLAINHNDKVRFREYPQMLQEADGEEFTLADRQGVTVGNWGKFGCGVVYRNYAREPIKLDPVPTRIFGIGMHKTATTSLHHALLMLGYDSAHWNSAHWAKAIWMEMRENGTSPTLERSYAVCDLPIPLLFRELDKGYPGSRFILTLREEGEWLESVRGHWSGENRFRKEWDSDPFSHMVHKALYGRRDFDAETFLNRYRQHNAEVLEYFKDRPGDLLVMDMNKGAGWYELCGFLNQPVLGKPYPRRFKKGD